MGGAQFVQAIETRFASRKPHCIDRRRRVDHAGL